MFLRHHKLRLLFFLLFSLYVISPTSSTLTTKNVFKSIGDSGDVLRSARNFHIYLWELIYTQLANTDNNEDSSQNDSSTRIILKKKRAVVPKNVISKLKSLENAPVLANTQRTEILSPVVFLIEQKTKPALNGGKPFLFSGLSPPSV